VSPFSQVFCPHFQWIGSGTEHAPYRACVCLEFLSLIVLRKCAAKALYDLPSAKDFIKAIRRSRLLDALKHLDY
jgi:hypothetical protein